jgi:hypothetical protein
MKKTEKVRDYINRKGLGDTISLQMKGHLKIITGEGLVVFDRHNLIVNTGKGLVMDILASLGSTYTYVPSPFNAIVLTKNQSAEVASNTFQNSVFSGSNNQISNEGVLHVGGSGGGQVAVTHVQNSTSILVSGTIAQQYGNDPSNNHINSVCLCSGVNGDYGGPGQGVYSTTGNERLFARVHVGDLVKTVSTSFNFQWLITIQ